MNYQHPAQSACMVVLPVAPTLACYCTTPIAPRGTIYGKAPLSRQPASEEGEPAAIGQRLPANDERGTPLIDPSPVGEVSPE